MDMVEGSFGTFMASRPTLQYNEGVELRILNGMRESNQFSLGMQMNAACSGVRDAVV